MVDPPAHMVARTQPVLPARRTTFGFLTPRPRKKNILSIQRSLQFLVNTIASPKSYAMLTAVTMIYVNMYINGMTVERIAVNLAQDRAVAGNPGRPFERR